MDLNQITQDMLNVIDSYGFKQEGAYNLRYNGSALCHGDSENIKIVKKEDKAGIDIFISSNAQGETVHIPVVVTDSDFTDIVYNDFYVEDGADVVIIAGCGIHNDGCGDSQHNGIHSFHIGKNAKVKYEEKHYGTGLGTGKRVLNPATVMEIGENSVFTMDTAQIKGVDSTMRTTTVRLKEGARLVVTERLMTHLDQVAVSDMTDELLGEGSSAQIISRSVAKGDSVQKFHPIAVGDCKCQAHIQCDSIIMDKAKVTSIPQIDANDVDAAIIHEAAIGRINNEQLTKLRTLGMTEQQAEEVIIEYFLN